MTGWLMGDPMFAYAFAGVAVIAWLCVLAVVSWEPSDDERAWMDAIDRAIRHSSHRMAKCAAASMGTAEAQLSRAIRCAEPSPLVRLGRLGPEFRRRLGEILVQDTGGRVVDEDIAELIATVRQVVWGRRTA